ncbi:MAG: hypothetical protein GF398_08960 [Chitinivibrionales bacterium]|nr:hypothetical protein [Chitinivibrionales bacterium]
MIVAMQKAEIVIYHEHFAAALAELQTLETLHLETVPVKGESRQHTFNRMHLSDADIIGRDRLKEIIEACDAIIKASPVPAATIPDQGMLLDIKNSPPEQRLARIIKIRRKVTSLKRRYRNMEEDLATLDRYKEVAHFADEKNVDEGDSSYYLFLLQNTENAARQKLVEDVVQSGLPADDIKFFDLSKDKSLGIIISPADKIEQVKHIVWDAGGVEFSLPPHYRSENLKESLHSIEQDVERLPRTLQSIRSELDAVGKQWGRYVISARKACNLDMQQLAATRHFVEGSFVKVLHVWMPVGQAEKVQQTLAEATLGAYTMRILKKGFRSEEAPVALDNPGFVRPFEVVLKLFPPPTHKTFDPSVLNMLTIPIFFGFIVGDIAYGLIIMGALLAIRNRFHANEDVRAATTVGMYCGISTIIFGAVFAELFGSFGHHVLGLWPPLFNREDPSSTALLLLITIGIGALHIGMGTLAGIYNARKLQDSHGLLDRIGQLLCVVSFGFLALGAFTSANSHYIVGVFLLLTGLVFLYLGQGALGVLEITGMATNILSYSRLMALGVASVVIARVANEMFAQINTGLIGFIVALIVAVLIHGLNIVLSMFSPTIHTLRLHYVEFFTKFYKTDGRKYVPFGREVHNE